MNAVGLGLGLGIVFRQAFLNLVKISHAMPTAADWGRELGVLGRARRVSSFRCELAERNLSLALACHAALTGLVTPFKMLARCAEVDGLEYAVAGRIPKRSLPPKAVHFIAS